VREFMVRMGDQAPLPHITLHAPNGLEPDLTWLAPVGEVAGQCPTFTVSLGAPQFFDVHVLYLAVHSKEIRSLHEALVRAVSHSTKDSCATHEGGAYIPHLTLARFNDTDFEQRQWARSLAEGLTPIDPFEVHEIVIFEKVGAGPYVAWRRLALRGEGGHEDTLRT
jgi:2'-5' RNA ligase